jgi:hypothetical protein
MIKLFNFLDNIIKSIENNIFLKILENIKNNIYKNKNFDSIIIDLIEDIDLFFLIKSNYELFNIINKNISKKILNEIYQIIPKNINKSENNKKNNNRKTDNDFLIINYNEDNKEFNNNDINNIILKIFFENPSFVIISTQNCNKKEKTQYQYILGSFLEKNGYVKLVKNNNTKKLSMVIYYNEKKVIFNKKKVVMLIK